MKTTILHATDLYNEVRRRYDELTIMKDELEKRVSIYPKGRIHVIKHDGSLQYYLRREPVDSPGKYISKKDSATIQLYLQKRYDEEVLKTINLEISNLERLLNSSQSPQTDLRNIYSRYNYEIKKQITPVDMSDEDYADFWISKEYERKEVHTETEYRTEKGEIVRSKSELNIANMLHKFKIPYNYEMPFVLKSGIVIHPDFTVWDSKKRREVYWEHRGMMDDSDYALHSVKRLKDYSKNNVIIGDNLIITEETSLQPLGTDEIERIIKTYFI